jgi:uncharacterized Rmd1/YagE family protein
MDDSVVINGKFSFGAAAANEHAPLLPTTTMAATTTTGQQHAAAVRLSSPNRQRPFTKSSGALLPQHSTTSTSSTLQQQQQPTAAAPKQTKRVVTKTSRPRKAIAEFRKQKGRAHSTWTGRVGVHVPVDEIDIEQLSKLITLQLKQEHWESIDYYDALRLWQTEPQYFGQDEQQVLYDWPMSEDENAVSGVEDMLMNDGAPTNHSLDLTAAMPEVYMFTFGVVVFWNFPSNESEQEWIKKNLIKPFPECYGEQLSTKEIDSANDQMAFEFGDAFSLKRDVATLTTRETGEKLAVSFGLAKSSLLSVYEERVQRTIERNSHIPEEMAKTGTLHMTRQDISREVGRMLLVKHGINLDQSLIDTPEGTFVFGLFKCLLTSVFYCFFLTHCCRLQNSGRMIGLNQHMKLR